MSFSVEIKAILILVVFLFSIRSGWNSKHLLAALVNITIATLSFVFFFTLLFKPPELETGLLYSLTYAVGLLISYNLHKLRAGRPKKEKPKKEDKHKKEKPKKEKHKKEAKA